jgi:hypothetical protein
MDDVLVCGSSQKEHDERLEKVLSAIEKAGLTLNEKCVVNSVIFGENLLS